MSSAKDHGPRGVWFRVLGLCWAICALPVLADEVSGSAAPVSLTEWGRALFFDPNLSWQQSQSCATCHDPAYGFADPRETEVGRAVSMGDDMVSFGDRNAPTIGYAAFSPAFGKTEAGVYRGGQFHDGRADDLAQQAQAPMLNPIEMGMPSATVIAKRLAGDDAHLAALQELFGIRDPDAHPDVAFQAAASAIAAFEETEEFAPFDSKYDRYLRGELSLTDEEELGRILFFSPQFTNCNLCHQLRTTPGEAQETFSNYEYHNIGVPVNRWVRAVNGTASGFVDLGLLAHPGVDDPAQAGKFKVPTLRNVAVTAPYMHNGIFDDLRTVILFYNTYNTTRPERHINPETGTRFGPPEVAGTLSLEELETGPALDDQRVDALVAFLRTLTDARYEPLLARETK
ncbi:cytochrome c peroxidase [Thioclava sp. SK-1]|uniref:cytochrome-c peroxidase n=1 Tax=Thioclava sp. SK-1 TaxID=1889770 RepID=UPI0009F40FA4